MSGVRNHVKSRIQNLNPEIRIRILKSLLQKNKIGSEPGIGVFLGEYPHVSQDFEFRAAPFLACAALSPRSGSRPAQPEKFWTLGDLKGAAGEQVYPWIPLDAVLAINQKCSN